VALWLARGWILREPGPVLPEVPGHEFPLAALHAVASAILVGAAAFGWGALVARRLDLLPRRNPWAGLAVCQLLGNAVAAMIVFAVSALHLLPWGLLVLLPGLAGWRGAGALWRGAFPGLRATSGVSRAWLAAGGLAAGLAAVASLAPVVESDGLRYHLFTPQEYLKAGGLVHLPFHAFSNLPLQTNLLYLAAMALGEMRAAQLLHWLHLPLAMVFAGGIARGAWRGLGRREECGGPGIAAGVLTGTMPVALVVSAWPFVDLSTLAFLLGGVWALLPGSCPRVERRALLAGLLFGAAIGTKLTALIPAGLAGLWVLGCLGGRERRVRVVLAFGMAAALVPAPWFVKSTLYHGNPVYPAAWGVFGGGEWDAPTDAFYKAKAAEKGFGRSPLDAAMAPLDLTLRWSSTGPRESVGQRGLFSRESPGFEDQNPGPGFLALLPAALLMTMFLLARRRRGVALLLASQWVGAWGAWFLTYQSVRFALFALGLTLALGAAGLLVVARGRIRLAAHGALLAVALAGAAWHATYVLAIAPARPVASALGWIRAEDLLPGAIDSYLAVEWLNREVEPGEAVLYIGEHRGLYARYDARLSDWFDRPLVLHWIRTTPDNEEMVRRWRAEGIRYVLVNYAQLRQYQTAYFRPRFSAQEWARYEALVETLLARPTFVPRAGVFVVDLNDLAD
jgi:hypothetical protein